MDINTSFWFFEKFREDNLCLLYNGSFSDEITDKFVRISEFNIVNFEEFKKLKKRISFLMIECFQNIVRHGEKKAIENNEVEDIGFFSTRNYKGTYQITSGNLIENKNIENLQNQLKKINSLSSEDLKALHRDVMQNTGLSQKGGAGLGLIDIARKSGQKLEYVFENYRDKLSFYYNQVTLISKNEDIDNTTVNVIPINESIDYHKKMLEEKIMVIQKGDFSHGTILPVLNIIETNLKNEFKKSNTKKQIYHILVELLQNINKHCLTEKGIKEGILIIGKTNSHFVINAGNYIREEDLIVFENHLKMINRLSSDELSELYLKKLFDENEYGENAGIGLIDIARGISVPLSFNFIKTNQNKYFYSISITV